MCQVIKEQSNILKSSRGSGPGAGDEAEEVDRALTSGRDFVSRLCTMDFLLRGREALRVLSQLLGRHRQICISGRSLANILAVS